MTGLTGEQIESLCEIVEHERRETAAPAPAIVERLAAHPELSGRISREGLDAAYRKWKRHQRVIEDLGEKDACGDAGIESVPAPEAQPSPESAIHGVLGALMAYLGQSVLRAKYSFRRSEYRLRDSESAVGVDGPGEVEVPGGRVQWVISAVVVERDGAAVRAMPECRLRAVSVRGGSRVAVFNRIVVSGTEANLKGIASSFGAMLFLYKGPGHETGLRRLAASLGMVTAANLSHHARRMAAQAERKLAPEPDKIARARFPQLRATARR